MRTQQSYDLVRIKIGQTLFFEAVVFVSCFLLVVLVYHLQELYPTVLTMSSFLAIDGNYTEWSKWSDCSVTCGGGKMSRSRTCANPHPKHGGKNCDELGPADETQECKQDTCREYIGVPSKMNILDFVFNVFGFIFILLFIYLFIYFLFIYLFHLLFIYSTL